MNVSRVWITSPNVTPTVLSYTRYNQPPQWGESNDVDIHSHLGGGAVEMSEIYNMIILRKRLNSRSCRAGNLLLYPKHKIINTC